jgi:cytidylate kinase
MTVAGPKATSTGDRGTLIIAIDGPSGVGKTTTSRLVARALGIPHIDTGAMYRALALAATREAIDTHDAAALEPLASRVRIDFIPGEQSRILLNGEDVSALIRTPEISMAASDVSAVPAVRRVLVRLQQELGGRSGGVLEGRDIGTKVFPETPYKFFLTARPEVRAERRHAEMVAKGESASYESILAATDARDEQDSNRSDSPLRFDDTYTVVDTSDLTIGEVVTRIANAVRGKQSPQAAG